MGSGPYGLNTVRDEFADANDSVVMVIYDLWREKGAKDKTQVRTDYMMIEDVVKEFGDCIYQGWYTEGWEDERLKASMWIMADEKHRVDPVLYDNWTSGLGYRK